MALKKSVAVRNAELDALETAIGTSAVLKIRTGAPPTNISDADAGTVLATINLPSDWMAAAASGQKAKSGTWKANASADVTSGHFRLYASNGTTPHIQGTITLTCGGGDMTQDNVNIANGQQVTVNTFTLTAGNA